MRTIQKSLLVILISLSGQLAIGQASPMALSYNLECVDGESKVMDWGVQMHVVDHVDEGFTDIRVACDSLYFLRSEAWDRWFFHGDSILVQALLYSGDSLKQESQVSVLLPIAAGRQPGAIVSGILGVGKIDWVESVQKTYTLHFTPRYEGAHSSYFYEMQISKKTRLPIAFKLYTPDGKYSCRVLQ